ncbi:MAG: DUF58 domain-containing protein [Christensenellales bacterium]|jgi:hypothetical protein
MWKSRLGWCLWLISAFLVYVFSDQYASLVVLIASFVIPVLLGVLNKLVAKKIWADIIMDETAGKGWEASGFLVIKNDSILPIARARCILRLHNILSGEESFPRLLFSIAGKSTEKIPFSFSSKYCGKLTISVDSLCTHDFFGVFRVSIPSSASRASTILPDTFVPGVSLGNSLGPDADGTEYSTLRPGFDPSEVFAVREYMAGDSRKQIHWKLTEKLGHLMIREPGLPLETTYMFMFETSYPPESQRPSAQTADSMAEVLCSLAQAVADMGVPYHIGWQEHASGLFFRTKVQSTDDLLGVLPRLLGAGIFEDPESSIDHYLNEVDTAYAHIIYITPYLPGDIMDLAEKAGRVTVLLCSGEPWSEETREGKVRVLSFTPDYYEEELNYLAI